MSRTIEVDHNRLERWIAGFADRHGGVRVDGDRLRGSDGATAQMAGWAPVGQARTIAELTAATAPVRRIGFVLVRRGGYAIAACDDDEITVRKVGRRHVQSRTAAGGWSQQRFARRRGKQADELVGAVIGHAIRLLDAAALDGLVRGGDRALVRTVLADRRLAPLDALPNRELYDLPDPSPAVLTQAVRRARAVRITLTDEQP